MLLAVAAALMLAQGMGAALLYRAQAERRDAALVHAAAFRLLAATRSSGAFGPGGERGLPDFGRWRGMRAQSAAHSPLLAHEQRDSEAEEELRRFLAGQAGITGEVVVTRRPVSEDAAALRRSMRPGALLRPGHDSLPREVLVAGLRNAEDGRWSVARVMVPGRDPTVVATLIGQTALIYVVLVGAIAFILSRITRPLAALTRRLESFPALPDAAIHLDPQGPDDIKRLIDAHNKMEDRISALLDEKDVMLGAIGHDLKTPLAALRVRIESVEDDTERARMAATIEDIVRSLDDILSLARVGRPSDPLERLELSALVAAIVEEFEDMGEPVELGDTQRIALPLRETWVRRALRNLIGNAMRYGARARVTVERSGGMALVRIDDDGPGIPDGEIAAMLEPFTRGEPSRNSETGGAGLGLTLARAIAEQHGGTLTLANRRGADGSVEGLTATLGLPLG